VLKDSNGKAEAGLLPGNVRARKGRFCWKAFLSRSAGRARAMVGFGSLSACAAGGKREIEVKQEKGAGWMPWLREAMKDVASCDKPRGDANSL
jgi:hypothetical protein